MIQFKKKIIRIKEFSFLNKNEKINCLCNTGIMGIQKIYKKHLSNKKINQRKNFCYRHCKYWIQKANRYWSCFNKCVHCHLNKYFKRFKTSLLI